VLKVPEHDTFKTPDLFEGKDAKAVLTTVHSLGRVAQLLPGYSGPVLGATLATATARTFTEAQLLEARAAMSGQLAGSTAATNPVVRELKKAEAALAAAVAEAKAAAANEEAAVSELAAAQAEEDAAMVQLE
jgi:hypothetical protein